MSKDIQNVAVVILAAGKGKRMGAKLDLPKVLYPLSGKPMLQYSIDAVGRSRIAQRPVIVIAPDLFSIRDTFGSQCDYAVQDVQLGTGHAVQSALTKVRAKEHTLVLYGDQPLVSTAFIDFFVSHHIESGAALTMATLRLDDFEAWRKSFANFGRIRRDSEGKIGGIVELRDADEATQAIREVAPGFYCFKTAWLDEMLPRLSRNNAQGEYYLTDLVGMALSQQQPIAEVELGDAREALGINTAEQLEHAELVLKDILQGPQAPLW